MFVYNFELVYIVHHSSILLYTVHGNHSKDWDTRQCIENLLMFLKDKKNEINARKQKNIKNITGSKQCSFF